MVPLFALCLLTAGCASLVRENYVRPDVATPPAWSQQAAGTGGWPESDWWKRFQSPELDRLISDAQENNYDVKAAAARVAQSRAGTRVARAGLFPVVTAGAGVSRSKSGDSSSASNFDIGPQLNYEIDVWGKNRFTLDAANAALLSTTYAGDVVRLSLTADVAAAYFQLLSLNDRLRVSQENLTNARSLLGLVEAQKRAGKVSGLEVERQRTQVAGTEAAIPPILQQIQATRNALAVLLGRNPGEVEISGDSLRTLPLPAVDAGLPSGLLNRRPDIRKAEADLVAQSANIGAARAALFPSISLTGQGGFASTALSSLFNPGASLYSIGLNLLGTIFDAGSRSAQVDIEKGRKAELVAVYQQSIVSAFRDAEDALAGVRYYGEQEKALRATAEHAREAYRIAETAYRLGSTDFTTVLDAQRTLLAAEAAVDPVLNNRFTALIGLYQALGGGWEDPAKAVATTDG
jgi:NodT family efflux transporter outer membrane factor (OMF) lipoprotein